MNIYEKLLAITSEIGTVAKNLEVGVGQSQYKAVGEADVLRAVKQLEAKYKIYSYPSNRKIVDSSIMQTRKEYNGKVTEGNQLFMRIEVEYTFVNIEKPDEIVKIITYGDGVDTQDKAPGKAMTYADKYALLKAYKIVTGEDPDQQHSPDTAMYDNANIRITKTKVQALEQAIQNANITKTQVDNVINYFNYNKLEEIQNKDYMEICNRLKALKGA